ncbi:MAG: LysR family transcriptional regulator [Deltaproteobacteria bacterium]|nr:LysR family transcriptional regulator [Deltaproteobacteria bacterium]
MELSLFSLRVFLEVAEKRSFSRAAESLLLSQPAVSMQIQKLENYFCTTLVVRNHGGNLELTESGANLKEYARKFADLHRELVKTMECTSGRGQQRIRLGTCCIAGAHLLPPVLKTFSERHPETGVMMNVLRCAKVFEGLLSGSLDVGVTGFAPPGRALFKRELLRVPLVLFTAGRNLPSRELLTLKDLLKIPLFIREEGAGTRLEFQKFLRKHGASLRQFHVISVSESNQAIKHLVREGSGFSVLPAFVVAEDLQRGDLAKIELTEGEVSQGFYVVYRRNDAQSARERSFIEILTEKLG